MSSSKAIPMPNDFNIILLFFEPLKIIAILGIYGLHENTLKSVEIDEESLFRRN